MNAKYSLVNEDLVLSEKASILVTDLAVQRGYGIFDFFKTLHGKPVFLEDHLDRFYNSVSVLRLPFKTGRAELRALLQKLMDQNQIPDSGVRITLTGGYSPDGFSVASPNMIVTQQPLVVNSELSASGIRLITHDHQRQLPQVKSLDYIMAIWLQQQIAEKNAQDVLYCPAGIVTECPRANFFIVTKDDRILTPSENILKGVIRKQLLKMKDAFEIEETGFRLEDIYNAKEAFITSTTKNVLPVVQVNDKPVGQGVPGKVSLQLRLALEQAIHEHLEKPSVQYA
jgi:branched-chain amino acid aminotransferase